MIPSVGGIAIIFMSNNNQLALNWAGQRWTSWCPNGGQVGLTNAGLRLELPGASASQYSDAQIDDYAEAGLRWRPPLRLSLRARLGADSGDIAGTAGFGLWNDPGGSRLRRLRLPRACWFLLQSAPGELALDTRSPGRGWMAMTMDASQWRVPALLPLAPAALIAMQQRWLRERLWPIGQWALRTRQARVHGRSDSWRRYQIDWLPERVRFSVDGRIILDTPFSPGGPLGLVLWIDNQYAIVRPDWRIGGGLLDAGPQWLEVADLRID